MVSSDSPFMPYWGYLPDIHNLVNLYMTLTPILSYGSTVYSIHKKRSSVGFSIEICATMLMAAILRICYYFVTPYEITLFRQSCSMIFIQLLLLKVSLHYRRPVSSQGDDGTHFAARNSWLQELQLARETFSARSPFTLAYGARDHIHLYFSYYALIGWRFGVFVVKFFDVHYRRPFYFWQWLHEAAYWRYIGFFGALFTFLTLGLHEFKAYGEFIGMMGLFIESLLPLPQILLLLRLRSVENFKTILLVSWLSGDVLKLSYLFWGTSNISGIFVAFALFQMALDGIIAGQWWYYRALDQRMTQSHNHQASLIELSGVAPPKTSNPVEFSGV